MIRLEDFPARARLVDGRPIVYLDNAATTLRHRAAIEAVRRFDENISASAHRGSHALADEATELFEAARDEVASFFDADRSEVVFTAGTTAALNLVAASFPLDAEAVVVTTTQEHHALLLPFHGRARLRYLEVGRDGRIDPDKLLALVDERTRLVAVGLASNVSGAISDVAAIARGLRGTRTRLLVDAAQAAAHVPVSLAQLGADYVAASGHKMYAPTGVGVLVGRREALELLAPAVRGGGAVLMVGRDSFTLRPLPHRLEPGTQNVAGVVGFGAALRALRAIGRDVIAAHGDELSRALVEEVSATPGVELLGPPPGAPRVPLVSFVLRNARVEPEAVARAMSDAHQVLLRAGHMCCHPYFDGLGLPGAIRASASLSTTVDDVRAFGHALRAVLAGLGIR
jgi:cysteine desulfurase / selenocysteine lyase